MRRGRGFAAIALASSILLWAGCAGNGDSGRSVSGRAAHSTPAQGSATGSAASATVPSGPLMGDEDDDDHAGEAVGVDPEDSDADGDNDRIKQHGYFDRDDGAIRAYGHAPSAADRRELTALVTRYHAAAAAENGTTACSLLAAMSAKTIPEDYGRGSAGPAFLREASTCPAVLTLLFQHMHSQLSEPIQIVLIRVKGHMARVLVGASGTPAAFFEMQHEADGWRNVGILASTLE